MMIVSDKNSQIDKNSMDFQMSVSFQYFISGIKSKATQKTYLVMLEQFRSHFKIRDYDDLLKLTPEKIKQMIEQYVVFGKNKGLRRSTINNQVCSLSLFYEMNDVDINTKRAKKMYPPENKKQGYKPYSTEQMQEMLNCLNTKFSLPWKSSVLIMASSGCRVGFAQYLKVKHIGEFEKNGCKSVLIYGGDMEEYYSFINPETVNVIDQWLEYRKSNGELIDENSWIIPQPKDHTKPIYERGIHGCVYDLIKDIDRGEKVGTGSGTRYDISLFHSIRKRWNTIAKNTDGVNYNKVEKMYGHSTSHALDNTYYKPEFEELFKEYEKFSDKLAVSKEALLEAELVRKNKVIEDNQAQKDQRLLDQESRIVELEKIIKRFTKY